MEYCCFLCTVAFDSLSFFLHQRKQPPWAVLLKRFSEMSRCLQICEVLREKYVKNTWKIREKYVKFKEQLFYGAVLDFLQFYIRQVLLYRYTILIWLILTPAEDKLARVFPKPMLLCRDMIIVQSIKLKEGGNIQIFNKDFKYQTKSITQDEISQNRIRCISANQTTRKFFNKSNDWLSQCKSLHEHNCRV